MNQAVYSLTVVLRNGNKFVWNWAGTKHVHPMIFHVVTSIIHNVYDPYIVTSDEPNNWQGYLIFICNVDKIQN